MVKFYLNSVLFVTIFCGKISASPQLDLPLDNSTHIPRRVFDGPPNNRLRTNGHANKVGEPPVSGDHSNEVGVGDTLNYDRDRSHRYGPPYSEENDRRYYTDNFSPRYGNQNFGYRDDDRINDERYGGPGGGGRSFDDDDKYHVQNGPKNNDYFISEKQRNLHGYRDYYSVVCQKFSNKLRSGQRCSLNKSCKYSKFSLF